MEIVQVVFFGVLIGGMITFLGVFLHQRHSSVRRRLRPLHGSMPICCGPK